MAHVRTKNYPQAAMDCVQQWRCEPMYLNGIPVPGHPDRKGDVLAEADPKKDE